MPGDGQELMTAKPKTAIVAISSIFGVVTCRILPRPEKSEEEND